jgi:hypothetical protein
MGLEWPKAKEFQGLLDRATKKVSKSLISEVVEVALGDEKQVQVPFYFPTNRVYVHHPTVATALVSFRAPSNSTVMPITMVTPETPPFSVSKVL